MTDDDEAEIAADTRECMQVILCVFFNLWLHSTIANFHYNELYS